MSYKFFKNAIFELFFRHQNLRLQIRSYQKNVVKVNLPLNSYSSFFLKIFNEVRRLSPSSRQLHLRSQREAINMDFLKREFPKNKLFQICPIQKLSFPKIGHSLNKPFQIQVFQKQAFSFESINMGFLKREFP